MGRGVKYPSEDVRKELRAQAILDQDEPDLVEEGAEGGREGNKFVLHVDGKKTLHEKRAGARRCAKLALDAILFFSI